MQPVTPSATPHAANPGHDHSASKHSEISAETQREIDEAMRALDAEDGLHTALPKGGAAVAAVAKPAHVRGPRVVQAGREHRTGTIVTVGPTDIFLEFGPKELGIVPRIQYPEDQLPEKGAQLEVVIDKYEASESLYICSRPGSVQKADWEMLEPGQVVEARVTGVATKETKQVGLELEVAGHRAFMPAGQVSLDRVEDLSVFVGERVKAAVTRIERMGKGNIVLSRREVLMLERQQNAEKIKASLAEGQVLEGTVRKIMAFGAFVDIGGVDGLVHLSDLTFDRVGHGEKAVAKFVKEGQKVSVKVLKVDLEHNRISLGIKQVQGDPFATAANTLAEGAEVTVKVTRIAEFGAFCEIAPGVEGLLHISELDHRRVAKVEDVLKPDQVVQAKILKLNKDDRRISLSLKALKPLPEINLGAGDAKGKPGKGGKDKFGGRTAEEILKETPALRRLREKFKNSNFKGGLS